VGDEHRAAKGDDIEIAGAEAVTDGHLGAAHAGVDRVAVPPKRHGGPVVDGPLGGDRRRERQHRQAHQGLGVGEVGDVRPRRADTVDEGARVGVAARRAQRACQILCVREDPLIC